LADKKTKLIAIAGNLIDSVTNISNFLEAKGFKTCWAYNGVDAIDLCKEKNPDLLLIDIKISMADGFEVAKQLPRQKILFMCADESLIDEADSFKNSLGVISKPVDLEELLGALKSSLK